MGSLQKSVALARVHVVLNRKEITPPLWVWPNPSFGRESNFYCSSSVLFYYIHQTLAESHVCLFASVGFCVYCESLESVSLLRDMFMSRLIHARDLNKKSRNEIKNPIQTTKSRERWSFRRWLSTAQEELNFWYSIATTFALAAFSSQYPTCYSFVHTLLIIIL